MPTPRSRKSAPGHAESRAKSRKSRKTLSKRARRAKRTPVPRSHRTKTKSTKPALVPESLPPAPAKPRSASGLIKTTARAVLRTFYEALEPGQWDRILATHPPASPAGKLLAINHDPQFADLSPESRCAEAGLEFKDLVRIVSEHALGTALMQSSSQIAEVVDGLAESAKARRVTCDLCVTEGKLIVASPNDPERKLEIDCPKCGGEGTVLKEGSPRATETFLKLHGGLEEAPQAVFNNAMQINFGSQHAAAVHRGQQLLESGRNRANPRSQAPQAPIDLTPSAKRVEDATENEAGA